MNDRAIDNEQLNIESNMYCEQCEMNEHCNQVPENKNVFLCSVVNNFHDGIILLNQKFEIELMNETGRHVLECLLSDTRTISRLKQIGNISLVDIVENLAKTDGKSVEHELVSADTQRVFNISFSLLHSSSELNSGLMITSHEITHIRKTQEQLLQSSKMASLGMLAAGIAHELNNPLTVVIGQVQLLKMKYSESDFVEELTPILDAGERAKTIVENILEFSHSKRSEYEMIDINKTIHNTLSLLGKRFVVHNIELSENFDLSLPPTRGDKGQLQQLFLNIIQNSCDAIISTETTGKIEISTCLSSDHYIKIVLHDNGPGMPDDVQTRVFDPFYTTKPPGKGTGLGLSICHKIVQKHDGRISMRSKVNVGTTFTIELPVEPAKQINSTPDQEDVHETKLSCILIDSTGKYEKLNAIFEKSHLIRTEISSDLPAAIEKLQLCEIDLVFIDIKMQHVVGTILRGATIENWRDKIVFITEFRLADNIIKKLSVNGYRWITQDCSVDELQTFLKEQFIQEKAMANN